LKIRNPILRSVLVKLMAILLVTGLIINMSVFFFFGALRHYATDTYNGHLLRYIDYLITDIGLPPDPQIAQNIADATGMVIRFQSPTQVWSTGPMPIDWTRHRYRVWYQGHGIEARSWHGNHHVDVNREIGRYSFALPFSPGAETHIRSLAGGLLLFISLVLIGTMWVIRRILRPLKRLKTGVERVGEGDLDHVVKTRGNDELHHLAQAFNKMTRRLKTLIRTKDRLLLDVSHELRTPITRMKVALEFLDDTKAKQSIVEDLIEMETMVTEILSAARTQNAKDSLKRESVDLSQFLDEALKPFASIPPGIRFNPPSVKIPVSVDPGQIRTVLKNILENALKYASHQKEPVSVEVFGTSSQATLRISDRGIGIPADELTRIFEPFYRVDKSRDRETGGFGLGLSICKNIIEAHDGRIDMESEEGRGTIVTITLPI